MTVMVLIRMVVKPGQAQAHIERLKTGLPETAATAAGCISLAVHRDLDDPDRFVVVEQWESRDAFQTYFNWRKSTGALDSMGERLAAPLEVSAYEGPLVSGKGSGVAA